MPYRLPPGVVIEKWRHPIAVYLALGRDEILDCHFRIRPLIGCHRDLHAIARGQNHPFQEARATTQIRERSRQAPLIESKPLTHLDRRGLVVQTCDDELHRRRSGLNPTCAAQVSAEKATTLSAMTAALRPRQPAVIRRKIITR